jgi:hypothetical protein
MYRCAGIFFPSGKWGRKRPKMAQPSRVARGQSSNAQHGDRRVETQFQAVNDLAVALRNEELLGNVTSFVLCVQRADGALVSHTSQNLVGWKQHAEKGMDALLDQAASRKWSTNMLKQTVVETVADDEDLQDADELPYSAGVRPLNLRDLRSLVRLVGFADIRKRCLRKKRVPLHMSSMLEHSDDWYFDLGKVEVTTDDEEGHHEKKQQTSGRSSDKDEEDNGHEGGDDDDNSGDGNDKKKRHNKHGTSGTFVQLQNNLSAGELMIFQSWQLKPEGDEEIDEARYLRLSVLLDANDTKISHLTRSWSLVALRFSLEFYTACKFFKLIGEIHFC